MVDVKDSGSRADTALVTEYRTNKARADKLRERLRKTKLAQQLAEADAAVTRTLGQLHRGDGPCSHPAEDVASFNWESDNGFGVQHWHTALECTLCGAVNRWGTGFNKWDSRYAGCSDD